ncbi:MAG: hypothetical protein AAF702_15890 [Chloroflexota bacterium]
MINQWKQSSLHRSGWQEEEQPRQTISDPTILALHDDSLEGIMNGEWHPGLSAKSNIRAGQNYPWPSISF